jgi:FkbM family methyltransferase
MRTIGLAHRVLRDEGLASLLLRVRRRLAKRLRFAAYRMRAAVGLPAANSPACIVEGDLATAELAMLEAMWRLSKNASLRVLVPDFLHCPLASIIRLSGARRIVAISYSDLRVNPGTAFDAVVLNNGQLHRLPLDLLERVLDDWTLVAAENAMAVFASPSRQWASVTAPPARENLRSSANALRKLAAQDLLYDAPFGAMMRCHYSDMEIGMIDEVWNEYFGWGIDPGPHDVIVDIGANIGAFAVACGMRSRSGTVYAYEPCPDNFRLLEENIARNCPGMVQARRLAVHRDCSPRTLYLDPEHSGAHSVYEKRWAHDAIGIDCVSLAAILASIGRPVDILKIDAEGSEYEILFACPQLVRRQVRTIVMEAHRRGRWTGKDLVEFLSDLDFSIETKGGGNLMLILARSTQFPQAPAREEPPTAQAA